MGNGGGVGGNGDGAGNRDGAGVRASCVVLAEGDQVCQLVMGPLPHPATQNPSSGPAACRASA